ncbi:LysR family transcriptional regulator [Enterococcus sp. UD-01]|uniref:LysR family transcriptional regulator n=1 Tax=Enterococcus sp. UD-01 TaxID=3373911 RepID=UPI0038349239
MELRLLRYFWTVAEEKNFSRAAQLLRITQPTLSRQIKELEEELGTPLLVRSNRELELTEAGHFLKERAAEILTLTENTERSFRQQQEGSLSGHFSIGCVEADNSDTLAMMLEELVSDYPQVTFNIVSGTSDDIRDRLEKGLVDLALLLEPVAIEGLETLVLPRVEKWGLLVAADSFLAQNKTIQANELKGIPLLSSGRPELQQMLEQWLGYSFADLNIIGTYNLIFNVFALVENRVGSALTIEGVVANRRLNNVKFIPLEPAIERNCLLVWKKTRIQTPVVKEFIRRFKEAFKA